MKKLLMASAIAVSPLAASAASAVFDDAALDALIAGVKVGQFTGSGVGWTFNADMNSADTNATDGTFDTFTFNIDIAKTDVDISFMRGGPNGLINNQRILISLSSSADVLVKDTYLDYRIDPNDQNLLTTPSGSAPSFSGSVNGAPLATGLLLSGACVGAQPDALGDAASSSTRKSFCASYDGLLEGAVIQGGSSSRGSLDFNWYKAGYGEGALRIATAPVPLPAALPLALAGFGALVGFARRRG